MRVSEVVRQWRAYRRQRRILRAVRHLDRVQRLLTGEGPRVHLDILYLIKSIQELP